MSDMRYFGKYFRFDTTSKEQGMYLLNADNLIGDAFTLSFEVEDGRTQAWLINKFNKKVGFLSFRDTYELDVLRARDWKLHALLSDVLYTETDDDGSYWGEIAVIANPDRYETEIASYLELLGGRLADGFRPVVDLTEPQIDKMLAKKGEWTSPDNMPKRTKAKGTATIKTTRSLSEKVIEQGRSGNPGCYVVSYAFIAVIIVGVFSLIAKLFGFF